MEYIFLNSDQKDVVESINSIQPIENQITITPYNDGFIIPQGTIKDGIIFTYYIPSLIATATVNVN